MMLVATLAIFAPGASAQTAPSSTPTSTQPMPDDINVTPTIIKPEEAAGTVKKLIWFVITFLSGFVVLIGIVVLIILGLKMMTATSPEKAQQAKAQFARVLVGLAIVTLAGVLVSTIVYVVTKPLGS